MAMRSHDEDENRPIKRLIRKLIGAPAALAFIWPMLLLAGGFLAWNRWGADYLGEKYFGLDPTLIQITEPPEYIRNDLVTNVYQDMGLDAVSLLEPQAAAKIASAFSSNHWVRRVNSVRKLPGGVVDVRVEYRQPVAMVRVISRHPEVHGSGFFVVDGEGVLLPTKHAFSSADTRNFIHIEVPAVYPTGILGTPFGEARVESAAKLAEALAPLRSKLRIAAISVPNDDRTNPVPQLELTTQDGVRVFWGSPPGSEIPGEAPAAAKLEALMNGDLRENLDLRVASPGSKWQ